MKNRNSQNLNALTILLAITLANTLSIAKPNQAAATDATTILNRIQQKEALPASSTVTIVKSLRQELAANHQRYFYLDYYGWVDGRHFFFTAQNTHRFGPATALFIGFLTECYQWVRRQPSAFSPEDLPSNQAGVAFASYHKKHPALTLASAFKTWTTRQGARKKNDPATKLDQLPLNP